MRTRVAIVYNEPCYSRYNTVGEEKAVLGVLEAVEAVHQALSELGYDIAKVVAVLLDLSKEHNNQLNLKLLKLKTIAKK